MDFTSISFDPVDIGHGTNNARVVGSCLIGFSRAKKISCFDKDSLSHLTRSICCGSLVERAKKTMVFIISPLKKM